MSWYHYEQLPPEHIRLLNVLPAVRPDDILRCTLVCARLPEADGKYEALSYTWRDMVELECIRIDGRTFPIGRNLADASSRMRYVHGDSKNKAQAKPRILWVDAICVNQVNDEECTTQVGIMREIFGSARQVLAWLGEDTADRVGARAPEEIGLKQSEIFLWKSGLGNRPRWTRSEYNEPGYLDNFLACTWFGRLWVVQEVYVARGVSLICGSQSIPWTMFQEVASWMASIPVHVRPLSILKPQIMDELLTIFEAFKCSDDRDRIAALVGLRQQPECLPSFQIDHSKSVDRNYVHFASYAVAQGHAEIILDEAAARLGTGRSSALPSWVPDWRVRTWSERRWGTWPHGLEHSETLEFDEYDALRVTGLCSAPSTYGEGNTWLTRRSRSRLGQAVSAKSVLVRMLLEVSRFGLGSFRAEVHLLRRQKSSKTWELVAFIIRAESPPDSGPRVGVEEYRLQQVIIV